MNKLKLGWIGLGTMGNPIVKNLLRAGYQVNVFNRTREKEREAIEAGAASAENPRALIQACDVVFTMVSDDAAVKMVFEGEQGLLTEENPGKLIVDMSTVSPQTSIYLGEICRQKQIDFLEAPVSGSVKQAADAALIILAGGTNEGFQKAQPIFETIGKLAIHLGDNGSGSSAKLGINYLVALTVQSLAETVLFAASCGISQENMLAIINESTCASGLSKFKADLILKDEYPPAFALKLMAKDLRLIKGAGLASPLLEPVYQSFQAAQDAGLGDEDLMAIIKYLRKNQELTEEN